MASACFPGLSPGEIAKLYRPRWQIYLALIAALLLVTELGRRPGKRLMELLRFHQMGWAEDAEVERGLERNLRAARQAAARKNQA